MSENFLTAVFNPPERVVLDSSVNAKLHPADGIFKTEFFVDQAAKDQMNALDADPSQWRHYILDLDTHEVHKCSLGDWAEMMERRESRRVASTDVGEVQVSTVFLGLDHNWGIGAPLIFETMVFGGPLDQEMDRYSTWDEAEAGHAVMVQRVRDAI